MSHSKWIIFPPRVCVCVCEFLQFCESLMTLQLAPNRFHHKEWHFSKHRHPNPASALLMTYRRGLFVFLHSPRTWLGPEGEDETYPSHRSDVYSHSRAIIGAMCVFLGSGLWNARLQHQAFKNLPWQITAFDPSLSAKCTSKYYWKHAFISTRWYLCHEFRRLAKAPAGEWPCRGKFGAQRYDITFFQAEQVVTVKAAQASQKTAVPWGLDEWCQFLRGELRLSNLPKKSWPFESKLSG